MKRLVRWPTVIFLIAVLFHTCILVSYGEEASTDSDALDAAVSKTESVEAQNQAPGEDTEVYDIQNIYSCLVETVCLLTHN